MDSLASVGRSFSNIQFVIALVVALAMVAGGIYLLTHTISLPPSKPGEPEHLSLPNKAIGGVLLAVGCIIPFAAWWRRKLIRTNPTVAAVFGVMDLEGILKNAF